MCKPIAIFGHRYFSCDVHTFNRYCSSQVHLVNIASTGGPQVHQCCALFSVTLVKLLTYLLTYLITYLLSGSAMCLLQSLYKLHGYELYKNILVASTCPTLEATTCLCILTDSNSCDPRDICIFFPLKQMEFDV